MTDKKIEKVVYKNPDGEIFDPEAAIMRHPALENIGVSLEHSPSYDLEFTIRASSWTMARLCQILNAAPVNGDPLHAIVNLWGDTTVTECEREDINYFLSENGYDATLKNIATGYLYAVDNKQPLEIDVVADERKEYAVARVLSKTVKTIVDTGPGYNGLSYVGLRLPSENVVIETFKKELDINDFKGETIGKDKYRIIHVVEPGGEAPLGGFILERIKEGTNK